MHHAKARANEYIGKNKALSLGLFVWFNYNCCDVCASTYQLLILKLSTRIFHHIQTRTFSNQQRKYLSSRLIAILLEKLEQGRNPISCFYLPSTIILFSASVLWILMRFNQQFLFYIWMVESALMGSRISRGKTGIIMGFCSGVSGEIYVWFADIRVVSWNNIRI